MSSSKKNTKIYNSFLVVGINHIKLQKYNIISQNEESNLTFIKNIDIVNLNVNFKKNHFETKNEKLIKISPNSNGWLRMEFDSTYIEEPITDLQLLECDTYGNDYLLLPIKSYEDGYRPINITNYIFKKNNIFDIRAIPKIMKEQTILKKLENSLYVLIPMKYNCKNILNLPSKKAGIVFLISRKTKFLPLKRVALQKNPGDISYKFCILRHKSPYSYKYLPEILDTYPPNEKKNSSIALFCFPDGIKIQEKFETPKNFTFVLTDELGNRTYGSVIVFWQELDISLKQALIPNYFPEDKVYYMQKAICIISNYPFYYNSLLFLKEIFNITETKSVGYIPIERAICTFIDSMYIPPYDKLLRFNINNKNIDFYRIPNYGKIWDTNDKYLETLFRLLSYDTIITAWEGLLLEKKLYIICNSKNVLCHISHALINLLFPFNWIHVLIPILPERLKLFIESPVPLIIGISFPIEINEIPKDGLILNVNKNRFENYKEKLPPLPNKLNKILMNKLIKLKEMYKLDNPQNVDNWISNQDEALIYLGPDILLFPRIDTCEIRDAFFSFFLAMFKNYMHYFKSKNTVMGTENVFLKEEFLKEHNSLDNNSFLYLFCETALFSQFSDFLFLSVEENAINSSFAFFVEKIKIGKGKSKYFLPKIIPPNIIFAPKIEISDLNQKKFIYEAFPKMKQELFIKHEEPKIPYKSRFLYFKDEWCYSPEKLKKKEWPKYFLYLIYDIWFTFFSFVLNIYEDNQAIIMMDYALSLVEYLNDTLKIPPTRNLFSKIIKSCARSALNPFIKQLLNIVKNVNKGKSRFNFLFQNEYLNGLYFLTENVNINDTGVLRGSLTNSSLLKNTIRSSVVNEMKKTDNNIESKLNTIIFMTYNLCENCLKNGITKCVFFDEILAGFIGKNKEENKTVCDSCLNLFEPKIYFMINSQDNLDLNEIKFLSPMKLVEKIDEIIKEKGELYFYKENEWSEIYWNIVFYFQLFDLPTCVLYVQNNMDKFEKLKNILKENTKRRYNKDKEKEKEKKQQKRNFFLFNKLKPQPQTQNESPSDISSNISTFYNSDLSVNSLGKQNLFSDREQDIWKNHQLRKMMNNKNIEGNLNEKSNENKNEIMMKISETKSVMSDIINYFCNNSQENLSIFLEKYNKMKNMKNNNFINAQLNKENDKYINNIRNNKNENPNVDVNTNNTNNIVQNSLKSSDKFSTNANLNFKINKMQLENMNKKIEKEKEKILKDNIISNNNNNSNKNVNININNKINQSPRKIHNTQNIYNNNLKMLNSSKNENRYLNLNYINNTNPQTNNNIIKANNINNNLNNNNTTKIKNIINTKTHKDNQLNNINPNNIYNNTYSNNILNENNNKYQIPKTNYNAPIAPVNNLNNVNTYNYQPYQTYQNYTYQNQPKNKKYIVKQVNTYRSIYDNNNQL